MGTLAVIGASYLQRPLVEKAKEMGHYVLCFAWREGAVCEQIADEFFPISIVEKEQILAICEEKIIEGVCSIASDVAAPTVAFIAEKMGLVGNRYDVAVKANNKFLMREAFSAAGVPCPAYQMVRNVSELEAMRSCHFPVIVKPSDRSGSLGVKKVEEKKDLQNAVNEAISLSFTHQVMVEEYIDGREISVEYISYHGHHFPLAITDKVTTGSPHFVELEHHQPSSLSPDQYDEIYKITNQALDALGVTDGASHSEYKITSDGRIYIMEIGARMGGDFIGSDLVRLSTGYDYVKGVIDIALGQFNPPAKIIDKYSGVFFLCKETESLLRCIKHSYEYPEIVKTEILSPTLQKVTCSGDRSGYFIYQSDKRESFYDRF